MIKTYPKSEKSLPPFLMQSHSLSKPKVNRHREKQPLKEREKKELENGNEKWKRKWGLRCLSE